MTLTVRHMSVLKIFLLGLIALALVAWCVRLSSKKIGGIIGGVLGLAVPFLTAQVYVWRGGDPTAAGALGVFIPITVPFGIVIGVVVGELLANK